MQRLLPASRLLHRSTKRTIASSLKLQKEQPVIQEDQLRKESFEQRFVSKSTSASLNEKVKSSTGFFSRLSSSPKNKVGLFNREDFKDYNSFKLAIEKCKQDCYDLVEKISKVPPGPQTVHAIDELSNALCNLADPCNFICINHPEADIRDGAADAAYEIGSLVEELNNEVRLYYSLEKAMKEPVETMDESTELVGQLFLRDFEQCGTTIKDDETREKAVEYSRMHLELQQMFQENVDSPGILDVSKMPEHIQKKFPNVAAGAKIDSPWSTQNDELEREVIFRAYYAADHANGTQMKILQKLLQVRHNLALLYGYNSWGERAVQHSLANDPRFVVDFLENVLEKIGPNILAEKQLFLDMKKNDPSSFFKEKLLPWDEFFYSTKQNANLYIQDSGDLSEYLTLKNCMNGISIIAKDLFGYRFEACNTSSGEIWDDHVVKLAVHDIKNSDKIIAYIYCDLYSRENKSHADCHYTIQCSRKLAENDFQIPIIVVALNIQTYGSAAPIKLSYEQAKTLFHEMGHALHSVAGRTDFQHVSGTRVATDIAEVPSILNEFFFQDDSVVQKWAVDSQGNPISLDLWHKFSQKKTQGTEISASTGLLNSKDGFIELGNLCKRSLWDQAVHGTSEDMKLTPLEHEHKIFNLDPETNSNIAQFVRFGHILQYDGKFYAYQISQAMAGQIWEALFKNDPLNHEAGQRYLNTFLGVGGSRTPRSMYSELLGKDVCIDDLANSLIKYH